jgi:hypothetical protein
MTGFSFMPCRWATLANSKAPVGSVTLLTPVAGARSCRRFRAVSPTCVRS